MATVHRAEDTLLRREVAVKRLHAHLAGNKPLRARFLREARAAAGLDHPGILRIFDVGDGDEPFIVMELLAGQSLKAFLEENGPPLAEMAALLGATLGRALQVAHDAGVIHRDVKPANVMVTAGRLVLCDFGLARMDDDALSTQSGETLGTPAFMAPEQALGKRAGPRSDVYSLGATIYQVATGSLPFGGGSAAAVVQRVLRGELERPLARSAAVGPELDAAIMRSMAREPDERFATASAQVEAFVEAAGTLGDADMAAYFAAPGAWNQRALPGILAEVGRRARLAASSGKKARALALCDRILALDPANAEALSLAASLGVAARRRKQAAWIAVAAGAAGALALGSVVWNESSEVAARPDAPVEAPVASALPIQTATRPDAAVHALPDAEVASPAPSHRRAPHVPSPPDAGSASTPDAPPPPPPAKAAALEIRIKPWCDFEIDGKLRGRSPQAAPIELPAGHHTVVCQQLGKRWSGEVDLVPGETRVLEAMLFENVAVRLGADATVDGKRGHAGDVLLLAPGRHLVDLGAGAAYVDIPVHPCELRARPELACYER